MMRVKLVAKAGEQEMFGKVAVLKETMPAKTVAKAFAIAVLKRAV